MMPILIADSGATKCEWCCVLPNKRKINVVTKGISLYFLSAAEIKDIIVNDVLPKLGKNIPAKIFFYGTGMGNANNKKQMKSLLQQLFKGALITIETDILAAARALFGNNKGIACILGTGSNMVYYDGKKIAKKTTSLGYVLGDEGSGAYLGKMVLQHYLYNTFDSDLLAAFESKYKPNISEILNNVYKQPMPSAYIASFSAFLNEQRGHFMVENILEDGLHQFFYQHIFKMKESWLHPIGFVGGIAFTYKDVLQNLCSQLELHFHSVLQTPMQALVKYHTK